MTTVTTHNQPLAGMKVLDLTRVLAGPLCTMLLGDLGADVLKVERPGTGDDTRAWGPPFDATGESAYYLSVNRNKLSLAADLSSADDLGLILSLMSDADVVVENFLPGALDRVGLRPQEQIARFPRLVWCSITGFGARSQRSGYDFVVQAESGWMAITGEPRGIPMKAGVALADVIAGKDAAVAILAAIIARSTASPVERQVHISLADSARAALVNVAQNALVSGDDAGRWGNAHPNLVPYQLFETQDRPIVIAVGGDDQWRSCVRILGLDELGRDAQLATNPGRVAQRERVVALMQNALMHRTADDWIQILEAARVPCGVVKSVLDAIHDAGGASPITGMPSSVGGSMRYPPPKLDEHGSLVRNHGWSAFRMAS